MFKNFNSNLQSNLYVDSNNKIFDLYFVCHFSNNSFLFIQISVCIGLEVKAWFVTSDSLRSSALEDRKTRPLFLLDMASLSPM